MNVKVKTKVTKDADKLPKSAKETAENIIEDLKAAATLSNIPDVRKLEGTDEPYYRIKFGNYRMMLYYEHATETVKVLSITHRQESYKKHNLPWRK